MSRVTLYLLYPDTLKAVHLLPACFVLGSVAMIIGSFFHWWLILPLAIYLLAVWIVALFVTRNLKISLLAILTSIVQLGGYGIGFMQAFVRKVIFRRGRNEAEEIAIRKGK